MKTPRSRSIPFLFTLLMAVSSLSLPLGQISGTAASGLSPEPVPQYPTIGLNKVMCPNPDAKALAVSDVNRIIQQAVTRAMNLGVKATIAVTDREVNVLAVYRMKGANRFGRIEGGTTPGPLELPSVPNIQTEFMAISKAGTGSVFQTTGNAFSPRSASFIIQENIPPGVNFSPGGPLFGVQFSNLFLISDVNPRLPLGISGDPGGVPLFMGEIPVGGIGVEVEGAYGVDKVPDDTDQSVEEIIARAGARGYESPELIQADNIYVDGVRLPFLNAPPQGAENPVNLSRVGKFLNTALNPLGGIQPGIPYLGERSQFRCGTLRNMSVRIVNDVLDLDRDNNRMEEAFPIRGNRDLSASEVETILAQAIAQAYRTRGAIRQPIGSFAEVNVAVVGVDGEILGIRATPDAPIFGLDVSAQKARSSCLFSRSDAAQLLRRAGAGNYVDALANEGIRLDGSVAFSDRGIGFLHRPFFPDGITGSENAPLSSSIKNFSPFNVGLQLDILAPSIIDILNVRAPRPLLPNIRNGLQIFAGGLALYKGGKLVGGIGISGDGIDQDDIICANGAKGFEAPADMRCDRVFVRGVRLPYQKFPRHPELP